jgi:hypothetical protein
VRCAFPDSRVYITVPVRCTTLTYRHDLSDIFPPSSRRYRNMFRLTVQILPPRLEGARAVMFVQNFHDIVEVADWSCRNEIVCTTAAGSWFRVITELEHR